MALATDRVLLVVSIRSNCRASILDFHRAERALVVAGVISCLDHDQEDQEWHVRAQTLDQTCFHGSFILVIANVCNVLTFFGVANNLHSLARVQFGVGAQRSGAPSCHRECGVGAQRSGAPRSPPNASPAQRGPRRDFSAFITYVPGGFISGVCVDATLEL